MALSCWRFCPHLPTPSVLMPGSRTHGFRRLALALPLLGVALFGACSPDEPTGPSPLVALRPVATISDATQGNGDAHFYWLPPIAPAVAYGGTFDPDLQPQIRICRIATQPCASPLVTFQAADIAVSTTNKSYSVDWSTKPANITVDDYRAEVWIAERKMGFADIRVVANAKDLKNVPTGFAGVLKSKSLTLAFRLEFGIVRKRRRAPGSAGTAARPGYDDRPHEGHPEPRALLLEDRALCRHPPERPRHRPGRRRRGRSHQRAQAEPQVL